MRSHYDVVIVGGGPAGLAAAEVLAGSGRSVLVAEKNEDIGPKICAGVMPTRVAELGIPPDLADRRFSALKAHTGGKTYLLSLRSPFAVTVDRGRLGRFLLGRAVAEGTEVKTGMAARAVRADRIEFDGQAVGYTHLIGADGSVSTVRRHLGVGTEKYGVTVQYVLPREYPDFEIFFDARIFGSGYGWIVPHDGRTVVGLGRDRSEIAGNNLKATCRLWCQSMGIDLAGAEEQAWLINYDHRQWRYGNVFLIGDAGGFASGWTGEGIFNAIVSGQEAARKIIDPAYGCPHLKRILKRKRQQEGFHRLLQVNAGLSNIYYRLLCRLAGNEKFARRFIDFFH
jgi:flavin-dependent dehydrogenase